MRALKLLGLSEDGAGLVCEEPTSGERFFVPSDDRVLVALRENLLRDTPRRAASARADGPAPSAPRRTPNRETPMEPQLRPRDIQARIRAGATLEAVAADAGCEPSRIERFAFPVLMERSMIADRGRQARPVVDGAPVKDSVEKLVRITLAERGQADTMSWDAYRTEAGAWILLLTWNAGRSENTARWTYHHSATSGTVTALDDAAAELMDPAPRPLRTVREPVVETPAPPLNPLATQHVPAAPAPQPTPASAPAPAPTQQADRVPAQNPLFDSPAPAAAQNRVAAALAHHTVTAPIAPAGPAEPREERATIARTGTDDNRRSGRAPMPSWEDVLLGTRSPGR
ncbi:septation protein SepH [Nakamurella deserti]|uniref:septation protein SepH n=1 Tax=Nakamurella deserti TaxID=2164074 RepID=UPI000DBE691F|nr:septation protein SepH [Nakamurella deserti]